MEKLSTSSLRFLAISLAVMLIAGAFAIPAASEASAQSSAPYGTVSAHIRYVFTDGTSTIAGADTKQNPPPQTQDLTGSGSVVPKKIDRVQIQVFVYTTSTSDKVVSSSMNVQAQVKDVNGNYRSLRLFNPSYVEQRSATIYWIYTADLSKSELESMIGTIPSGLPFWPTEIMASVLSSKFSGTIAGKTGTFSIPFLVVTAPIAKTTAGVVPDPQPAPQCNEGFHLENGTCIKDPSPVPEPSPTPVVPHGRVYSLFEIKKADGITAYIENNDQRTFPASLLLFGQPQILGSNVVESITFKVRMRLDNYQQFNVPHTLGFQENFPSSADHYDILIGNKSLKKDNVSAVVFNRSNGLYDLFSMTITKESLEPHITTEGPGTFGDTAYTQELVKFFMKGYQLNLSTAAGVYPVVLPEFGKSLSIGSTVLPGPAPEEDEGAEECVFTEEGCEEPAGETDYTLLLAAMGIVAVGLVSGVVITLKKRN